MWLTPATAKISHVRNMCQTRQIQPNHDHIILGSNNTNRNGHNSRHNILTIHNHSMGLHHKVHILQITFHHSLSCEALSLHNSTRNISNRRNSLLHSSPNITTKGQNIQQHLKARCLVLQRKRTLQDLPRAHQHHNRNLSLLHNGNNSNLLHLHHHRISHSHPNRHLRNPKPNLNLLLNTTPLTKHHPNLPNKNTLPAPLIPLESTQQPNTQPHRTASTQQTQQPRP